MSNLVIIVIGFFSAPMDQDVSFGENATFNCIGLGVVGIRWTFNTILSCTAMSCNQSGFSVVNERTSETVESTVESTLVIDTSQLEAEVETTYTIQCILQLPGDLILSASLRVRLANSTVPVTSGANNITAIIGAVVASVIIVVFVIIIIIAIIVVTKSKRRNEFPMYEEIGMYTKCIVANHEYDKINDLMPNSSERFNTEAAHAYDRISNCSYSHSSQPHAYESVPEYENVLVPGLLDYPEGTRHYGIYEAIARYEKVPNADMTHILRQASLETQQVYEVIARYEKVPDADIAHILRQASLETQQVYEVIARYDKVPDADIAHILRQASLETQQVYEVIARYERVPHVDMAQILNQISRSSEERAHFQMYGEMSAYERVPQADMAQILNQISRSSEERAHVEMYEFEETSVYERVPHVNMEQILNQISRPCEERAHVQMYEETSVYERMSQADMAQILNQISRSSEERAPVQMFEETSVYERVPHVNMEQILNQISRLCEERAHVQMYEETSVYERVPQADMAQILNQISRSSEERAPVQMFEEKSAYERVPHVNMDQILSRYSEERARVQEMSAYERVPHADVTDMNPYKLYTSSVSGSGIDTGYSDYERAQVYEQITGYEQVPVADIAQILSTHATRCSAPNIEIPEVNMPQNGQSHELITAVCEQDMIPASAQVAPLYTRTQCSKEVSPVSLSAGVVPHIPDSYGKRKQNETINSVQWMVNKLKLGVANPKLDSIQHITGHELVVHNSSASSVISTNTHISAFDITQSGELTSSYESSPQTPFPLHSQFQASEIPCESNQVSPVEQFTSEYERIKCTTLTGGLSSIYSSLQVDQFPGYERVNYTSPTGRLLTNYSSSGDQFSGYERVNYTSQTGLLSSNYNSSSGDQFSGYERVNYTLPTGRIACNYNSSSGNEFSGYERVNYTSPTGRLSSNYNSSSGDQFSGYERVNYT